MEHHIPRRDFVLALPAALGASQIVRGVASGIRVTAPSAAAGNVRLEPLDYRGVRLGPSRWRQQFQAARDYYYGISDDDILQGFRAAAGLPAPGTPLGGWCQRNSYTVFGQWLSGMSRIYRATGDAAMRDKAVRLFSGWVRTVKPDGDAGVRHYPYDKMVCGLVDLARYAEHQDAVPLLERITDFAAKSLSRDNHLADPAQPQGYYGRPQEWYTLAENLYRAYQLTGNPKFRAFAEAWLYPAYWNQFAETSRPAAAHGVHAYSHVNTFSSVAMAYEVGGEASYLRILKNAFDYLQQTQCYATGGYGPNERFMAPDGSLGRALDTRSDTWESGCGSWAAFKLSRYLTRFTGEARYGDWMERILYNGVGGGLWMAEGGRNFYYADHRVGGGIKVYNWDTFTCCSATYLQDVADYHNIIYYRDAAGGLYVNLYVPSEVTWQGPAGEAHLSQETRYPEADTSNLTLTIKEPAAFPLRFRIPGWTRGASIAVNGVDAGVTVSPGAWAAIERPWRSGDRITIRIPLVMRMEPVDQQHPDRVAVVRGPVVLALEGAYHDPYFRLPERDDDLERWLVPEAWSMPIALRMPVVKPPEPTPTVFRVVPPRGNAARLKFRSFYEIPEGYPYFMYFDRRELPWRLW